MQADHGELLKLGKVRSYFLKSQLKYAPVEGNGRVKRSSKSRKVPPMAKKKTSAVKLH